MNKGFVLVELIVVMGIIATLAGIVYIRGTAIERRAPLPALANSFVADMKGQQTKAMSGEAVGGVSQQYGVHVQENQYILFAGTSFDPSDASNMVIPLPDTVSVTDVSFPDANIIFAKGSGDVVGYSDLSNTVTIGESGAGGQLVITVNQYGQVTSIQ